MTQSFFNMLRLFGCGALGKEPKTEYCENLSLIRKEALRQEVWDIVYSAVRVKIEKGEVKLPEDVYKKLENLFVANIASNMRRVEFNLISVRKIMEAGIKCCVLKGITVASLYAVPEARISSDTDILINEEDEEAVCAILSELGYTLEERAKYDHHRKAHHKIGGLMEVHVRLHSEGTREHIMDSKVEYKEEYMLLDNGIYTLGVNDGLMYLSAHLIKHFINDGIGVRQIMDLLLYMKAYENKIDWEKYNGILKELQYDNLIAVIKGIGVKYFGMEFKGAVTDGNGMEELLEDMEMGGLFGISEGERNQFYTVYTKRRSGKNAVTHSMYRLAKSEKSTMKMLFPSLKVMEERSPYVKKCRLLLPIAWIHRLFKLAFKQLGVSKEDKKIVSVNQRRMNMIEKLGMIK